MPIKEHKNLVHLRIVSQSLYALFGYSLCLLSTHASKKAATILLASVNLVNSTHVSS